MNESIKAVAPEGEARETSLLRPSTLLTRWPSKIPDFLLVDFVRLPLDNYQAALRERAIMLARIAELEKLNHRNSNIR